MFSRFQFRKTVLCLTLYVGALIGSPMRPDEIENLLRTMRRTAIVQTLSNEDEEEGAKLRRDD